MVDEYRNIIETLAKCRRVLVTTHVRPDGDALGSVAAMILGLREKGIGAEALLLSHLPTKYAFIFKENAITFHDAEGGWPAGLCLEAFDALLVVDTGTWSQLPGLREKIEKWSGPKIVIDHHLTQEDWADRKLVITAAAAAGEIVAELLQTWGIKFSRAIAGALYLAIVSDTGWFQHSNTRPFTMRLAAELMEAGVDSNRLYQALYQSERVERLVLQARAMNAMELLAGGRIAVMTVHKNDFVETGAGVPDTEGLINVPLQIGAVEVSVLISEPRDFGPVRVSLRSKGQVDVARFAEQFGGGGHARAAGLKFELPVAEVRAKVLGKLMEIYG